MKIRRIIRIALWSALALLLVIIGCNVWLLAANRDRIFRDCQRR